LQRPILQFRIETTALFIIRHTENPQRRSVAKRMSVNFKGMVRLAALFIGFIHVDKLHSKVEACNRNVFFQKRQIYQQKEKFRNNSK